VDTAISAIIAVAGTILGAALAYVFQSRASERAEASALQRELRAERARVYSSYMTALTAFKRGQIDWCDLRENDPDSEAIVAARAESYRLKGVAEAVLSQVRLVASNPGVVTAAISAFELTRPVHYAQESTDLSSRIKEAENASDVFVALAAAEIQSIPVTGPGRRLVTKHRSNSDT
jgi:hypothetical protein